VFPGPRACAPGRGGRGWHSQRTRVGHWLGLFHPLGRRRSETAAAASDDVLDTPQQGHEVPAVFPDRRQLSRRFRATTSATTFMDYALRTRQRLLFYRRGPGMRAMQADAGAKSSRAAPHQPGATSRASWFRRAWMADAWNDIGDGGPSARQGAAIRERRPLDANAAGRRRVHRTASRRLTAKPVNVYCRVRNRGCVATPADEPCRSHGHGPVRRLAWPWPWPGGTAPGPLGGHVCTARRPVDRSRAECGPAPPQAWDSAGRRPWAGEHSGQLSSLGRAEWWRLPGARCVAHHTGSREQRPSH